MMITATILLLISLALEFTPSSSPVDGDSDGLADELEQALLAKFTPKFMLSSKECDGLPTEFHQGMQEPKLLAKNGTIHGQVFPIALSEKPGSYVEIHYYHLWNRDCGINGHELDAEHVSALIWAASSSDPSIFWKAKYWYAAAHEETICDASRAAQSWFINAEQEGPTIYISAGKHASFLDQNLCRGGCGSDDCRAMNPLKISKLINLGERSAPMNGASWIEWPGWPLAAKMQTDFPEMVLARLDAAEPPGILPVNDSRAPVKALVLAGSSTGGALVAADQKTGAALSDTTDATGRSINNAKGGIGNSLKLTFRAVWKALGGSQEQGKAKSK
jgi:hypothetical protein